MLETYFVRPQTAGRIRACWIGAEIECYAGWLAERGYRPRTVRRHVQALVAFGESARRGGAAALADLPAHVGDSSPCGRPHTAAAGLPLPRSAAPSSRC
jgi:hypothetical protein